MGHVAPRRSKEHRKKVGTKFKGLACVLILLGTTLSIFYPVSAEFGDEHDIAVDNVEVPLYISPGVNISINATILNIGIKNEADIRINLFIDDVYHDHTDIPFLPSGEMSLVQFIWNSAVEGFFKIDIQAEPVDNETDLSNNQFRTFIVVTTGVKEGSVALISSSTELSPITWILDEMAIPYTNLPSNNDNDHILNLSLILEHKVVVFSLSRGITEKEYDILTAYLDLGGHLLLTGYGCLDVFSLLVELIGSTTYGIGDSLWDFNVVDNLHPMMDGLYATYAKGSTFYPVAPDFNNAKAIGIGSDSRTVAQYSGTGADDAIIARDFPSGGTLTFWNDNGFEDWIGHDDLRNMFKNYIDHHIYGIQDHDIMVSNLTCPVFSMPGDSQQIGVTIWNRGLNDETDIVVYLNVSGSTYDTITISLKSHESTTVTFNWDAPQDGGTYRIYINTSIVAGETVTSNNHMEKDIFVGETPKKGKVALISDQGQLAPISYILDDMGIEYDILNNNYPKFGKLATVKHLENVGLLFQYQTIVYYNSFRYITNREKDALMAYSRNGGNLMVTGNLAMSGKEGTYDRLMAEVLGIVYSGKPFFADSLIVNAPSHPIMNGTYGAFPKDFTIEGLPPLVAGPHALNETVGTITIAYLGGKVYDKITCLEDGGRAVFWNGNGKEDWVSNYNAELMFRNFIDWTMFIPGEDYDIWVTQLSALYRALPNETITITAKVFNRGLQNVTNLVIDLTVDGAVVNTIYIPFLETGHYEEVSFQWTPLNVGNYLVEIFAQPLPGENNTANNVIGKIIDVYNPIGYILVDRGHGNNIGSHYGFLRDLIFKRYWINYSYEDLTLDILLQYDMFFTISPTERYAPAEIEAIRDFIAFGHGMLVIGSSTSDMDSLENLTSYSGISWHGKFYFKGDNTGSSSYILSHPTTVDVDSLWFGVPYGSLLVSKGAEPLVYDGRNETIQAAVCQYYKGKIIALWDSDWLNDFNIEKNDTKIFGRNIASWFMAQNLSYTEHDLVVSTIESPDFANVDESIFVNGTIENLGDRDEHDVIINLTVNGTVVNSTIIPYIPPAIPKISSTSNVKIILGNVSLLEYEDKIPINIIPDALKEASPLLEPLTDIQNIGDGMVGDSRAVFFADGTSGPGEYIFTFPTIYTIKDLNFYQDDEYLATSYRIQADTDNDGSFETTLVEVTDDSGTGGTWITHEFTPISVHAVKFLAINGSETGSWGTRAFPAMHEFVIYEYDSEDINYGSLLTDVIEPSPGSAWSAITIVKTDVDEYNYIRISIVNGSTYEVILSFEGLKGTFYDLSGIDPVIYPTLRVFVEFICNSTSSPVLHELDVSWSNGTTTWSWNEDFLTSVAEVSFLWSGTHEEEYTVGIAVSPVPGEAALSNNEKTKMIKVFLPKGYILVDEGHSDHNSGYDALYTDLFNLGYWINYTSGNINSSLLANHSIFITVNPEWGYLPENPVNPDPEVINISAFVDAGGGLLVVGNYYRDQCLGVTKFAGIKWLTTSPPEGGGVTTNIIPHYVTYGTESLTYAGYLAVLSLSLSLNSKAVVYDRATKSPTIQAAVSTYGSGRVVALVNWDWFRGGYYYRTDNRQFAMNIFNWLMQNELEYDLSVSNLKAEDYLKTNETTEITAEIWNLGAYPEENIVVNLIINGTVKDSQSILSLDPGSSTTVPFSWSNSTDGLYNITVEVVPSTSDNNTANNWRSEEIRVFIPKANILVDNAHENDISYMEFYEYLKSQGYWVDLISNPVDPGVLMGYDIFITTDPATEFSSRKEIPAIQSFVENGGGLVIIGGDIEICFPLTYYAGIEWIESTEYDYGATTNIDPHPTTTGINSLAPGASTVAIEVRVEAQGVVYDSRHSVIWGAASRHSNGKVMALAGTGWFDEYTIEQEDNRQFGLNIIEWLTSPQLGKDTSLSNLTVEKYAEPQLSHTIQTTFHNWYEDKYPINISLWVNGNLTQNRTLSITYGTSRIVNFTWLPPPDIGKPQNILIAIIIDTLPGENYIDNNKLTAPVVVRKVTARLLFDQSHYADSILSYEDLMDQLQYRGYEINATKASGGGMFDVFGEDPNEPIASLETGRYNALIISQPLLEYNASTISYIQDYVAFGGGLLVIGDDSSSACESLTVFAGINWSFGGGPGDTTDILPHGITQNVNIVDLQCPMARLELSENALSLIRDTDGDTTLAISSKPGRVAAWVDEGSFWDDGIKEEDNMNLAINIIKWLTAPGVLPLEAPTLNATAKTNGILLNWTPNKEITLMGYELYRNSSSGGDYEEWELIATVGFEPSYFDTDVESETAYYYVVRAFDWNIPPQNSNFSNEANATVLDFIPPEKPTGLWIETVSTGNELTLHWTANTDVDLQGYSIFRCIDNITFQWITNVTAGNTSYNDTGLTDGVTYYYKILAFDEVPNLSPFSNVVSGVPQDTAPPSVPTGLTVTTLMEVGKLRLDWIPPPEPDLIGYRIFRSNTSGGPYELIADNWTLTTYHDSGLESETVYYYIVQAYDEIPNDSTNSTEAWGITMDSTPPSPPVMLGVTVIPTGNTLNVTWQPNPEPDVQGYFLFKSDDGVSFQGVAVIPAGTEYYNDTGLMDGVTYYYQLKAFDEVPNFSEYSNTVSGTPMDTVAPSIPTGLIVSLEEPYTLNLSWDHNPEPDVKKYWIYVSTDNITFSIYGFIPSLRNHTVIPNLEEGLTYYYYVVATDEVPNISPNSTVVNYTIFDTLPPATPEGLAISAKNGTTLFITWNEVTINIDGSPCDDFDHYVLYNSTDNVTWYVMAIVYGSSNTSYWHYNLATGQTYYYNIVSADEVPNHSPNSTVIKGTPTVSVDVTPPDKIENVTVTVVPTGNVLNISWDPSNAPDLAGYFVKWSSTPGGPYDNITPISDKTTYYHHKGLIDGVTYYYVVSAIDLSMNEGQNSDEASGVPQDVLAPSSPIELAISAKNGTALFITWNEVTANTDGGPCDDFDNYILYNSTDNITWYVLDIIYGSSNTSYWHNNLVTGQTYHYKIASADEVPNHSPNSTVIEGVPTVTVDVTPPDKIENVTVTVVQTGNELNISWNGSNAPDLAGYLVYLSLTPGGPYIQIAVLNKTYYLHEGLTDGVTYYYVVTAIDTSMNEGLPSDEASGVPQDVLAPSAPIELAISAKNGTALFITWNEVTTNTDGSPCDDFDHYVLYNSTDNVTWYVMAIVYGSSNTSYWHYNLATGQTYYYKIASADEVPNRSPNSTVIEGIPAILGDVTPPDKIENVTVTVVPIGNGLNISWDPSNVPDLAAYYINYSTTPGGPYTHLATINRTYFNHNGLTDGVTYHYIISAVDTSLNEGPYSDEANGIPQDSVPPSPPTGLTVIFEEVSNELLLIWTESPEDDVEGYEIWSSNSSGGPYTYVNTTYGKWNKFYTDAGLQGGTYFYVVKAFDEVPNISDISTEANGTVVDMVPPAKPTGVQVEILPQGNTLRITWAPVTKSMDGTDCTDLDHYEIYYRDSSMPNYVYRASVPAGQEYYVHGGLTDGENYSYRIRAVDNNQIPNKSPYSDPVNGTPHDSLAPEPPTGPNGTPQLPNRIILTWDLNTVDNDIEGYRIWRSTNPGGPYALVDNVTHPQTSYSDLNLEEDTYYYVLTAYDEVPNDSSHSVGITVTLPDLRPPATPENFTIEVVPTGEELNLSWDPVTENWDGTPCLDLDHYSIYRSLDPDDNFTLLANVSAGIEYYLDVNLTNGVTYYYKIIAVDDTGNSLGAAWNFAAPGDLYPPSPPSDVFVTPDPRGSNLIVTWNPSPEKDVVYYSVYRSVDGVNWVKVKQTKDATYIQFTDINVVNGIVYYYRVTATDDDGKESQPSLGFGGIPFDISAPNPPSWVEVTPVAEGNALIISWEHPLGDIEGYYLYRADEENGLYNRLTIDPVDKATTIFIDTGLEDGKPYYFKVTCVDAVPNESPPSEVANGTPQDTVAPDAPIGLFANTLPEGNTMSLTWDPNTESDLEGYSILRGETPFALNWIADVSAGTTSYIDTTLTDGITYYYKIRAFDEVPNFSDLSSLTSAVPVDMIPPLAPTGLGIEVIPTGNSLKLTWDVNTEIDLMIYSIDRSEDGVDFSWVANVSAGVEYYLDTGLTDGVTHYYKIQAVDEAPNFSPFSEIVSGIPGDIISPSRPEGLTVLSSGESGSSMLLWVANTENDIAGYRIYRSTDNSYYEFIAEVIGGETTTFIDHGLTDEMLYFYRITAIDEVPNESPQSDTVSYVPHTLPPTPTGLTVTPLPEGGALNISWNPITDTSVAFYTIYRSTDDENYILIAAISLGTEYYTDIHLEDGVTYYYKITSSIKARVYEDFRETDYWFYIESLETTSAGGVPRDTIPPVAPSGLIATQGSEGIHLIWDSYGDGDVTSYNVYRYLSSGSTGSLVASGIESTNWTDSTASKGQLYYYSITAIDDADQESQFSAEVSAIWDVLVPEEEFQGRPLWQWNLFVIVILIQLILIGAVFIWMRKRSRKEDEVYESVRAVMKEEAKVYTGPHSQAGIEGTPGVTEQPSTEPSEEPPPPAPETMVEKMSSLERKLKNAELAARLKSLESIRVIGEAKTSMNTSKEIKTKIETKKKFVAEKVDSYIRLGMFPSSMRARLNELVIGFSKEQLQQFESITKARTGITAEEIIVEEEDVPEESIEELEAKLKEAEAEGRTQSQNALKVISEAKEMAKEAEDARSELNSLKETVGSKVDTCIRLGMFSIKAKDELTGLLMSFTPEQLEQFGLVAKSGPGMKAPSEENLCSACGSPLSYSTATGEWFCNACNKYQSPERFEEETSPPQEEQKPEKESEGFEEDNLPPTEEEGEEGVKPEGKEVLDEEPEVDEVEPFEEGEDLSQNVDEPEKVYSKRKLKKMKKTELRNMAEGLGIPSEGTKAGLIQGILKATNKEGGELEDDDTQPSEGEEPEESEDDLPPPDS